MLLEQGAIIWAVDPFKDNGEGRPWLVIGNSEAPFHGEQYICLALTSKTYHDEALPLREDDYDDAPLSMQSHIMPWSVATIERKDIERYVTAVGRHPLEKALERLGRYIDIDD
ncbi:PemK-like, MazF-like toxin of type II toxin-antitoxin system [Halogranum amylolyticum]|uniref:PemK-like, MazF-like toxin of type II toxin-antitoxin system n=1 Tax=Halogranum amylolyticum TaxID=660520 RepID=A0A1H8WGJ5_9EURY|nr:type II toxin-antitoxin system PemK/MazF family toxin [Halogranum amylolyticum]SEP26719.1 PemK-like, MazF-like toxin of type II toxin-antitoxin system [Halogranum amylolyticum]